MKKILFAIAIVMFALSCTPNDQPAGPKEPTSKYKKHAGEDEIKVMSFNIRTKTSNDEGINHWDQRKSACISLIKDQMPDIMGVQEAQYNSQWTYLKDQLKSSGYEGYGVNRSDGKESGSGEVVGVLWNKNVIKVVKDEKGNNIMGTFWLSETPEKPSKSWGMSMNRTATWGLFEHIPTGRHHGDPGREGGEHRVLPTERNPCRELTAAVHTAHKQGEEQQGKGTHKREQGQDFL